MTTGTSRTIVGGVALVLIAGGIYAYSRNSNIYSQITSYDTCVQAGYAVANSNPPKCMTPDGQVFMGVATTTPAVSTTTPVDTTRFQVTNVFKDQIVSSPLTITGRARGVYFEGSFPIELVDGNGKTLVQGTAQAQGDWMTSEFVPFTATLTFAKPTTATGTLIFRNDNPSGLPENSIEYRIPVRFSTTEQSVRLYYYDSRLDKDASGNILCSSKGLVAVTRTIPVTQTPLQDTIRLLLRGELSASEMSAGVTTEFPLTGVALTSAAIGNNGNATLTLADPNSKTSGGACRASVLKAEIEATARQFSTVKSVTFVPSTLFQP